MGIVLVVKIVEVVGEGIVLVLEGSGIVEFDGLYGLSEFLICIVKSFDFDLLVDEILMV